MSNPVSPEQPLRLLHLGDSYTCGEGVSVEETWPAQYRRLLQASGLMVSESRILAQTGWTSGELLQAFHEAMLGSGWDRITLCIGVNNQYRGLDPAAFEAELEELVNEAARLMVAPPDRLLLLSIPDWGVSPFAHDREPAAIGKEIDAFNVVVQRMAQKTRSRFLDWAPLTRTFADDPTAFALDGLHPSAIQYAAWAQFLFDSQLGY